MKNMKRVFLFLGCISTKTSDSPNNNHITTLENMLKTVQSPVWEPPAAGSKEEAFFDSKPWLESDDEQEFYSVNDDIPPYKLSNKDENHQGRRLSELFKDSSFNSESPTSLKALCFEQLKEENDQIPTTIGSKIQRGKKGKSTKHCLPSLARTLSCGDRKKRHSPSKMGVVTS
ncbi:uncharacterized protein At3g27210-like isoform X2 [Amaranthus tricolor]|uniref:uncharacterized protein At3g27210-like isoform X2 n=1 Tax=Amaranthus tricolor TaxID=29722 RepID=UPI0025869730|nr:uncharacterized protein At3g27210-like isoform X2 [Amaranthus tricolor]